jgi:hypothetical protein
MPIVARPQRQQSNGGHRNRLDRLRESALNTAGDRDVRRLAALAGAIAATALMGMAPAASAAAPRDLQMSLRLSGSVVAVWHGDPTRGCAAAGVCEVSGSATYSPGFRGSLEVGSGGFAFGGADASQPPVVRVREADSGGATACADVLESGFTPLGIDYLGYRLQVSLEQLDLSAGRCAGPRTLDLSHAFPSGSIAMRELRRGTSVLDLSARTKFAAGPFAGVLISTVKVALGRPRAVRSSGFPRVLRGPRRARRRYWVLDLAYRLRDVSGALVTDFRGQPDPACRALGACGAHGNSTYRLGGISGRIDLLAGGRLRGGRRRPPVRRALQAVKRGPRAVYGDTRLSHGRASVSETVASPGGTCSDTLFAEQPDIEVRSDAHVVMLLLRSFELGSPGDALRTRCPGPSQEDVLGRASLAHGSIPLIALGRRRIDVPSGSQRSFSRSGYIGSRSGQLVLRLELASARVYVVRG